MSRGGARNEYKGACQEEWARIGCRHCNRGHLRNEKIRARFYAAGVDFGARSTLALSLGRYSYHRRVSFHVSSESDYEQLPGACARRSVFLTEELDRRKLSPYHCMVIGSHRL